MPKAKYIVEVTIRNIETNKAIHPSYDELVLARFNNVQDAEEYVDNIGYGTYEEGQEDGEG